jgi:RNA polymerase sigma factor (sigma-70 family)
MTDTQRLLADYVTTGSEPAFRELVTRYLNLVYSTAVRLVDGDAHRAEDVAQTVFIDLARKARTLPPDVMLGGWLHRDTCFVASKTMRGERRRQFRERQAVEMNALLDHSEANLAQLAPILDEAINQLGDQDRTAILLRFFEQRDLRAVGEALGSTENAAQKRVTRALEELRSLLKHRGVTSSAAALGTVLASEAVTAAPVGLAAAISSAAVLAGSTTAATIATTTKAIAMTALQKTLIAATIVITAGAGIYEARQASALHSQLQTLQQQEAGQIRQWQQERDAATRQLAALRDDNVRLNTNTTELQKLRGSVARLSQKQPGSAPDRASATNKNYLADGLDRMMNDPEFKNNFREIQVTVAKNRYASLFKELTLTPEEQETLIRLRVDQVILNQDNYMAMLKGGDVTELQKEEDAALAKYDAERKALLGDNRFQQLKDYENTWFVRQAVDSFKAQQEDKTPLNDYQAQQLLDIMIQERAKNPPLENRDDAEITLKKFDAEEGQRRIQAQEQMNQQVLSRAAAFLNPEQIQALVKDQVDTLASQKKDLRTSISLWGEKTN